MKIKRYGSSTRTEVELKFLFRLIAMLVNDVNNGNNETARYEILDDLGNVEWEVSLKKNAKIPRTSF